MSVKATVLGETHEYISKMSPKDELPRECLRQQHTWEKGQAEDVLWQNKTLHRMGWDGMGYCID